MKLIFVNGVRQTEGVDYKWHFGKLVFTRVVRVGNRSLRYQFAHPDIVKIVETKDLGTESTLVDSDFFIECGAARCKKIIKLSEYWGRKSGLQLCNGCAYKSLRRDLSNAKSKIKRSIRRKREIERARKYRRNLPLFFKKWTPGVAKKLYVAGTNVDKRLKDAESEVVRLKKAIEDWRHNVKKKTT